VRVCRVVADIPAIEREFDYQVPDELAADVRVGSIVRVRLHGRRVRGWVVADDVVPQVAPSRLAPLVALSSEGPPPAVLDLCRWTAHRFVGSPVALYRSASPPNNVAPGTLSTPLAPLAPQGSSTPLAPLARMLSPLAPLAPQGEGSGQGADRELVSRLMEQLGSAHRRAIWWPPLRDRRALVLELMAPVGSTIVVTSDPNRADALVATLRRLGAAVVAWHADLSDRARTDAWRRAASGGCVVVGGRTSVFAPLPDLAAALIVDDLDEALQEERQPTWHVREVLLERCRRNGVPCTVISPLPSVVALVGADAVGEPSPSVLIAGWPRVEVVDLGDQAPGTGLLTPALASALRQAVDHDAVAVCLLNRRGRARLLYCPTCRRVSRWDKDGRPLLDARPGTADAYSDVYAGVYVGARPTVCLHCGTPKPRLLRAGVERVGDDLRALLGGRVPVAVVDASTETVDQGAAVLVGTESLLHRPEVRRRRPAVVAVLDLDQELFAARLRADEQALWLLAQASTLLAGRPRSETRLLLQTHAPGHPVVGAIEHGRCIEAQRADRDDRAARLLPPFAAQALLDGDLLAVDAAIAGMRLLLGDALVVKGPTGAGTKRRALVEHPDVDELSGALGDIASGARLEGRLRIEMDPSRA